MSFHAGQTFTFGEQPSATKWQYIWDNDYALADGSGISNDAIINRHIGDGAVRALQLDLTGSSQVQSYTNSGTAGGTVYWINLGGLRFAWGNSAVGDAAAWNVVDLVAVGFTAPPMVIATCTENTGSPPGWVEVAQKSPTAAGKPQTGGFSFLCRVSNVSNAAGTINFVAFGV